MSIEEPEGTKQPKIPARSGGLHLSIMSSAYCIYQINHEKYSPVTYLNPLSNPEIKLAMIFRTAGTLVLGKCFGEYQE
jgi:hypothetical protein